jgi:anti-anti-sigma regulatory factor
MKISVSQKIGRVPVTIFQIEGRINLGSADDLRQQAQTVYEQGTRDLLLDLSQVKSLTSEGLRAIHFIYKLFLDKKSIDSADDTQSKTEGKPTKSAHLKVLNPSSNVRRVLNISGFDMFIEVFDNLNKAIASF